MLFRNRVINKKQLKALIGWSFAHYGTARTAKMADRLKDLGFRYATQAGVSISVDDLQVPPEKPEMLAKAQDEIQVTEERYERGEITEVERFQKAIDTWNTTSEQLKDEVVRNFKKSDPLNSVYMMAFSGARGNISQVRQLVGMRGLMADPQGKIIDLPIKTNFREGLTVTEYIISSYGARKGLVDTALRTADSGYLTRRLVDVSQDTIVREEDCGTQRCIPCRAMKNGDRTLIPLSDRLLGRVLARDAVHPRTGELVTVTVRGQEMSSRRNQDICSELAEAIEAAGIEEVMVRSPLTCEAARSVCQACYGWSLAHAQTVDLGEAVGIIAAQSIGEPGTQLTMRTFHTGGVFTGEVARLDRAPFDGTLRYGKGLKARPFRTRHGDEAFVVEREGELRVEAEGKKTASFSVPQGATLWFEDGHEVKTNESLLEVPAGGPSRKTTEKATKDVAADLAGEILFDKVIPEEKKDRQGNTTRIAARGGLIWVLSGEVYNLPPASEPAVKNGDRVEEGSVLAVTKTLTENGGIVRLEGEPDTSASSTTVEIITTSVVLDRAAVRSEVHQNRDRYTIYTSDDRRFALTAAPGTKVRNGQVVAELIDDTYRTETGGILKYSGIEVAKRGKSKAGYEIAKGGTLLWIPEETHEINKDISLLLVEDGQEVDATTEVVKDIFCQNSGVVEVTQKNDILREIAIKPGVLHPVDDPEAATALNETLVQPGQTILGDVTVETLSYAEVVENPDRGTSLLLRPVIEYPVPDSPLVPSQHSRGTEEGAFEIGLQAVQRLIPYKDGDRIKSVDGIELLRTQLVLEIGKDARTLEADIELVPDEEDPELLRLQLVILETLTVRRDANLSSDPLLSQSVTGRVLVKDGDRVEAGAEIARTEIRCSTAGEVRGIREGEEAVRRILIVSDSHRVRLETEAAPTVSKGDLVVESKAEIAPGQVATRSGQVVAVEDNHVVLRVARPYRVSPGAILHVDDGSLVQRGDNLVLLVFERAKTGDIIQGLPRIEELLEARKPKEACLLAKSEGTVQVFYEEDETANIQLVDDEGVTTEYRPTSGQNVLVLDDQRVEAAEPLTDGPANPHEILEVFFEHLLPKGSLVATLGAFEKVQTFLVNEVQSVYQSQGIDISDKHIETIVRQMTSKVKIDDGGDTTMLPGELVELRQVEQVNEAMSITGGAPARYTPVLLGITKASLNTDSFISAASFQETTRVLTEAAIEGKSDWLRGLKENVIIGRLIPAGTGFNAYEEYNFSARSTETDYGGGPAEVAEENEFPEMVLDDRTARSFGLGDEDELDEDEDAIDGKASGRSDILDDGEEELIGGDEDDFEEEESDDDIED